jgi:hypothetical protein
MTTRTLLLTTVLMAAAAPIVAQTPAPRSATPTAPAAPTAPTAPRSATAPELAIPPPPPPAPPAPPSAQLARRGQPVNVKIEFTITDQRGGVPAVKRVLSLTVADAHTGQIRSQSEVLNIINNLPLNVDATPEVLADGKIRVGFNLQYDWVLNDTGQRTERGTVTKTSLHDSVSLILENGKPMVAAQSADPSGDRQVTVEVKATILK